MNNIHNFAIFWLVLSMNSLAFAAERFRLSCKVTDNFVLDVAEGKPQRYNGFVDGLEVGERVQVVVYGGRDTLLNNGEEQLFERLGISIEHDDLSTDVSANYRLDWKSGDVKFTRKLEQQKELLMKGLVLDVLITLGPDHFGYSSLAGFATETMRFERYYKNDWGGLFTRTFTRFANYSQLITFDCRGLNENIDGLYTELTSPPNRYLRKNSSTDEGSVKGISK